ncbi:hypothetical protein J3A83DRAFT_4261051 [Scleroderma citrinum]
MAFPLPSHLPRKVDVSSQILSKLDSTTWKTLDSSVGLSWRTELDECIRQTKNRIHERIRSESAAFDAQLSSAKSAQERLSNMSHGVNTLTHTVFDPESGITSVLLAALRQHQVLAQASLNADVIHASLLHLSKCKTQLETVQKLADTGDLPAAVLRCAEFGSLLAAAPGPLPEATVTADMKKRLVIIENRLSELLGQVSSEGLHASEQEIVVHSSNNVPGSTNLLPLSAVLSSLSHVALSAHLSNFRRDLTTYHFDHTLRSGCLITSTTEVNPSGSVVHKLQRSTLHTPPSHDVSLSNLSYLLDFLNEKAFPHLPQAQRTAFPRSLIKPLTTSIMANLLIPSLPSTLEGLPNFLELACKTVEFESRYISGLLRGDSTDREIKAWVDNVCVHYERARRINILDAFRNVVLESAALRGQTFMAYLAASPGSGHEKRPDPEQQSITEVSPTSETDAWNLDDDQSLATSSSKSAVDDSSWGFDDDIDQSGQTDGGLAPPTPEAKVEVDPGDADAWGWNDEETSPSEEPATEPPEEVGTWDDDPWAEGADVHESASSVNPPTQFVPPTQVSAKSQKDSRQRQETNGHVNGSSKTPRSSDHVTKESFPVSTLITDIVRTVENCLREGKSLASSSIFSAPSTSTSSPGTLIMHTGALVIDLYCALYPVAAAPRLFQPSQYMQYSNDCYYLSEELSRSLLHAEGLSDVKGKLKECREDLIVLADSWFHQGIEKQAVALNDILEGANGFIGTSDQDRYDECETIVTTVLRNIRSVAQAWKFVLPRNKYYIAIGNIVNGALSRILDDVLAIPDIPEVESHKLSELCRILASLEGLFVESTDESSLVVSFVPSWLKFSYLSELLEASMVDFTYLFEEGALVDFEIDELVKLVRALFADTPLRAKTLDKIMGGHLIR